jgi:hypothetical protein
MTTFLRNRKRPPRFVIVEPTNRWRVRDGVYYRECVCQLADGRRRLLGIRDDLVAGAA